ncbi:MAG: 2-(1,2-epoxy-1,2-dihydrophenyl)acetyl-CoA isomerase PaaG [Geminicoccaceae bacterium]
MSEPTILLTLDDGVATITLNRPDRLNAFTEAMHAELSQALGRIELDKAIRTVLLTGAGRGFCSGQDLNDRATVERPDLGDTLDRLYNPLVRRLKALERPVIAAVNGVAAGAGANLALACDIVIAAKSALFVQAFVKIGLIPDVGGSYALPRLVGQARAMGLAMLGEPIDAEKAAEWGLIWRAVDDEQLMDEATAMARQLSTQPTVALGLIKQAIHASATNDLDQQLELERDLQRKAGRTEDFSEGVDAFLDRRPATFKGR